MGEAKDRKEEHVGRLLHKAVEVGLDGLGWATKFGFNTIVREYNGIGPEFFPPALRAKVTEHLALFEPAAVIHDLRNYESDGTRYAFNFANYEFRANCRKLADAAYPWWNWRRYRARAVAELLYDFVSGQPGWKAWMDCYNRKETSK